MEKYIDVSSIKCNKVNSSIDTDNIQFGDSIYQIQGQTNGSQIVIRKVGSMNKLYDVLIKEFSLSQHYKYYMVSKIYDINTISNIIKNNQMPMIIINICKINKNTNIENNIGHLSFNFHSTDELNLDNQKSKLIDNNEILLNGYFTITFHFSTKYMLLQKYDKFCGNTKMMSKLVKWLFSEIVNDNLDKIV